MTRSPLFYPLNRGGDSEAGGAADLQTDVMRFMAILSLCLVAIFALVQSMPLAPTPAVTPTVTQELSVNDPVPQTPAEPDASIEVKEFELTRPKLARLPPREKPVALQRPIKSPVATRRPTQPAARATPSPVTKPAPRPTNSPVAINRAPTHSPTSNQPMARQPTPKPVEKGFTLQFETDAALTRLVARQVVGFYAMQGQETYRMNIANEDISFWSASTPAQFHEMEITTVPDEVITAFAAAHSATGVKWGVTLPTTMSRSLNEYLQSAEGGSLVIASNGEIDLRQ